MASLNRVFLAGNLTRDPEVRYIPDGKAVADLGLAVNRRYKSADGESRDDVCYVNIVVWGRQAETCGEYLGKGSPVLIEGRLAYDQWEKDGQKFNRLRVVANRVQFLGGPKGAEFRDKQERDEPTKREDPASEAAPATNGSGDDDNLPF